MKTLPSNADKVLIKIVIVKIAAKYITLNKKVTQGLDSFYNSTKLIYNIHHDNLQNHSINSFDVTSSILSKTSPSIEKDLQTRIRKSSISNSEVPENQINNENQSGNSAIKENTQHIHTKIYMFKRKPESDDISHFLKIPIYMFKVPSTCLKVNPKAMICPIFQKFLSLGLNLMLLKAM